MEKKDLNAAIAGARRDNKWAKLWAVNGNLNRDAEAFTGKPSFVVLVVVVVVGVSMIFVIIFLLLVFHFVAAFVSDKPKKTRDPLKESHRIPNKKKKDYQLISVKNQDLTDKLRREGLGEEL
ncbi:hypothetical protein JCGZ_19502 [Jatropha curcas]|uniref:Uncharacterized protein n=1 Tax=Jatropha curcas TaxID=180498 RepID=A0A067K1S2_JATCU|nr:hypothetical protein JCGZ_19502 [Jatropha curcas]